MPGWMAGFQSRAHDFKEFVSKTTTQTISFGKFVYRSVELPARTVDFALEVGEGLTRVLYPSNVFTLARSPKTRAVLRHSAVSISYALLALAYDAVIRRNVREYAGETVADTTIPVMDALALYLLCQQTLRMMADKSVYNAVISKTASQGLEAPRMPPGCGCGLAATIPATLMSSFYYVGDTAAIRMVCAYLPMGEWVLPPMLMLREGQALLEYPFSSRGYCGTHWLDMINKNNAYALGIGLSYAGMNALMVMMLRTLTVRDNRLLEKAFESLLYQYFIFMVYQIDRPLPGKKSGIDFFHYSRLVTESMVKALAIWAEKQLMNQKVSDDWARIQKHVSEFPPFKLLVRLLLVDQLKSIDQYVDSRAGQLYLDYYGENLRNGIAWILDLRHQELVIRINRVSGFLPSFILSKSMKKILAMVLNEKIDALLRLVQDFLDKVDISAPAKVRILSGEKKPDQTLVYLPVVHEHYDPLPPNAPPEVKKKRAVEDLLRQRQPAAPRPQQRFGLFPVPNEQESPVDRAFIPPKQAHH